MNIRNAARRLERYRKYKINRLGYERQLVTLQTGDKATGVLCYHCRELLKIGSKYVKKHEGGGGGPYHLLCARRLHII